MSDEYNQAKAETALQSLVRAIHEAGEKWLDAKEQSSLLRADEKHIVALYKAGLQRDWNTTVDGKVSDTALTRRADESTELRDYSRGLVLALIQTERLWLRRDDLIREFERQRSQYSTQRALIRVENSGVF
jgi:hypothetical protein